MSQVEREPFEEELQRLRPAPPPAEFMQRLENWGESMPLPAPAGARRAGWRSPLVWRWLLPAGIAAGLVLGLAWWGAVRPGSSPLAHGAGVAIQADQVEIDEQLVTAFDAIARMPDGQPVRFRCREWSDAVVLRDSKRGVVIENRTPRLEVVPVRFETY